MALDNFFSMTKIRNLIAHPSGNEKFKLKKGTHFECLEVCLTEPEPLKAFIC
jgi:hypothetical protein